MRAPVVEGSVGVTIPDGDHARLCTGWWRPSSQSHSSVVYAGVVDDRSWFNSFFLVVCLSKHPQTSQLQNHNLHTKLTVGRPCYFCPLMSPVKMHSFNPLFVNTSPRTEEGNEFSGQCGTSQDESSLHIEPFPGSIGVVFCPPLPPCWSSLNLEPADCNHLSGSFLELLDICPNRIRVTEHNMLTCPACPGGQEDKASSGPHSTYAKTAQNEG